LATKEQVNSPFETSHTSKKEIEEKQLTF